MWAQGPAQDKAVEGPEEQLGVLVQWDKDKLTESLRSGGQDEVFVQDLDKMLLDRAEVWQGFLDDDPPRRVGRVHQLSAAGVW